MCLAIPGRILEVHGEGPLDLRGEVEFSGVRREVSLAYVPEAGKGDWVLVHAGFALQTVDEVEAQRTLEELKRLADAGGGLGAFDEGEPGA
ncbi:HypC/HybG/HupF family hydrogenase formation chaperone [bacterium]|nr:HypC/HybG/HupF family hydrogenase formation chaperone [bacterium]